MYDFTGEEWSPFFRKSERPLSSKTFPLNFAMDLDVASWDNTAKVTANVKIAERSDDDFHTF